MVDVFGARASRSTVYRPIRVQREQIGKFTLLGPTLCLDPANALSCVFDHLPSGRYEFTGIDAPTMNGRVSKLQFEARVLRVNPRTSVQSRVYGGTPCSRHLKIKQFYRSNSGPYYFAF